MTQWAAKQTVFAYDGRGSRTRKTYHDGTHEDWTYDGAGNVVTRTTLAGQVLTVTRDARNRPTLLDWSDSTPDITASYDAVGRILALSNSNSALTYTYDNDNRLLSETQDINSPVNLAAKTVSYTYDVDSNRASLNYPGGTALSYAYTARNQLASVSADGPPPLATYTYDLAGNRIGKALENGTSTQYGFDNANRLLNVTHTNTSGIMQQFDYALILLC
jgi:YD repeat-containing protein